MTMKIALEKLEKIQGTTQNTAIKVAKIEEHLKNINGCIQRHEKNIGELYGICNKNTVDTAKTGVKVGVLGAVAGAIGAFILNLITKLWR